ncbi:MAG: hypothetical protein NTY03_05120 [Candidatus Bathyarchaeota archaeon]|nr:hypothetical protein [Candidatus Bathyarchaeota archaeon]
MKVEKDYEELFTLLNKNKVRYCIIGAYAVGFYSVPRYTKDIDVWVAPTKDNAKKIWKALVQFGAPLANISIDDFTNEDLVYQIGLAPNRIDILMGISGIEFDEANKNRVKSTYAGETIYLLSKSDLIKAKRASNRKQDQLDLEKLLNYDDNK